MTQTVCFVRGVHNENILVDLRNLRGISFGRKGYHVLCVIVRGNTYHALYLNGQVERIPL